MTREFRFDFRQSVFIPEIDTCGTVRSISVDQAGVMYKVVYWLNSKLEEVWVYENDLMEAK